MKGHQTNSKLYKKTELSSKGNCIGEWKRQYYRHTVYKDVISDNNGVRWKAGDTEGQSFWYTIKAKLLSIQTGLLQI